MQVQLTKWGNSVAVRLPKAMLEAAKLQVGDTVEVEASAVGGITVRKRRQRPKVDELVARITPENQHAEIDWGLPRGSEVW